jgi:hypothetical protein
MAIILRKAEKTTTLEDLQNRLQQVEDAGDLLLSLSTRTLDNGSDFDIAAFSQGAVLPPLGQLKLTVEPGGMTQSQEQTFFRTIDADGSTFITADKIFIEGNLVRVVVRRRPAVDPVAKAATDAHGTSNPYLKPDVIATFQSPNRSHRNGVKIDSIVLHCTEASRESTIREFMNPGGRQVSAHYVIDQNGDIYQMVPDAESAWHCKGSNANTIGIEHVGQIDEALVQAQQKSSVNLIKWLMQQYSVKLDNIFGHDFTPGRLTDTSCPDKLFGAVHSQSTITSWVQTNVAT